MRKLLKFTKGYRLAAFLAPAFVILEVIIEIYIPFLMSEIIDVGIANSDVAFITRTGLLMVGMAMVSLACGVLSGVFAAKAATGFSAGIRKALFDKICAFSFANVDRFSTASLVTRCTTDITFTQNMFMMMLRMMIRSPVMLISASIMTFRINRELAVIFLFAIPILGIFLGIISAKAYPLFGKMLGKIDRLNLVVQENLRAVREVKAYVREDHENARFREAAENVASAQVRAERLLCTNMPMMQFVMYACMIAIAWFGGRQIVAGNMLVGDLTSFFAYVNQILMSLMMLSMFFVMLVMSRASIARINEVLEEEIDIRDPASAGVDGPQNGSIEFDGVDFSYLGSDDKKTLEQISLKIESGETVGIIGGTGSGKTTLVSLIPRLYDALHGSVRVGGRDVREYRIKSLRESIGTVLQKNVLFSGTIKENLRWGNENATDQQIIEACKTACADEFISSFPDGYDTELGQGGVNLSGGQKQRLCIARALLKHPKIMIMDDSTSAVDTATDARLRSALRAGFGDTTTIIIAQRVTSVMDADKIVVMDEGRVVDVGSHEELLSRCTIYREVYESQQKGAAV